ncbi:MAG: hypothetical protein ACTTKL_06010 [Treponema sp.]
MENGVRRTVKIGRVVTVFERFNGVAALSSFLPFSKKLEEMEFALLQHSGGGVCGAVFAL